MSIHIEKSDKERSIYKQLEALSLHLLNYLEEPSSEFEIRIVLKNICRDLVSIDNFSFYLKEEYVFHTKSKILYNNEHKEIKLTKNEIKFMELMYSKKGEYFSSEHIEYSIWEDDSVCIDCNKRLKNLIYNLRKKLPKNSIINSYKLGYKLVGEE